MRRVVSLCLAVVGLLAAGVTPAAAQGFAPQPQQQQGQPPAQAYKVGTVTIKFVGTANVNEQVVRANMQIREGGEFDEVILDRDIRSLYRTGLFEFIEVKHEPVDAQTFNLVVEVTPKFRVLAVRFEGNQKVKSNRLEKEAKVRPNQALDERQVKEDAEKLREYYQKAGYNQVSVNYTIERDRVGGFGTVVFKIREGAKVKIADIKFVGNAHVSARKLRGVIETKKWWLFSWLTGSGRFKDDQFEDDLEKLRDHFREQGYLDVEIPQDKVLFNYPSPGKLVLVVNIEEGRQYRIGEISFSGNNLFNSALLKRVVRQKPGFVFVPSKVDADRQRLDDFYGKDGYLDTRIQLLRKPNVATGAIDLEYKINESERFSVESIVVEGNTKTKSTVILRELVLGPGDVFSTVLMKISQLRLDNTRFFESVDVTPQETNIPGRRNMRIAVREGRTGNLTFGAGFSSLERATLFAEVSQSNFDLFNRRSFFQGDGQKFRLRMQLGSLSSEVVLSFEEPWLFQKQLGLGFSVFRTSSEYNSTFYSQIQTGFEVYLRKHLWELWNGRLSYTYEIFDIQDISPSASSIIQALAGSNASSSIGLQLERDTRDKIINTTSGNRVEVNLKFAGGPLGGSKINNNYSLEFRGSQFFPVFETQTQVLSLIARGGVVQNFGDAADVPYYNKWYLGGPTTLRGFEFREVAPRDAFNEPIGGKTYGFFSAEYSLDIVSPIRFAIFYDAGFVNRGAYDFNPASYNDNFGFGLRLFVAGAPLSLDFGIPITGDALNKKGNQFNFSFGTRF
ncbi:outer membrane protein assembly factor BamA [Horticoccus sp. 23ND18S-11]|uniref:outer membrane protein assembly factor BamA n=1 Tax=Horticoccus sp. 23ND18S-11 TaxID=3391832 RepID=UPI0039C9DA3B